MAVGDDRDFADWYGEAHPRVVTAVLLATGNLEIAHDAADEACARAFLHWNRVSTMASPTGWTCRVAFNLVRRRGRRDRMEQAILRRRTAEPPMPAPAGEAWDAVRRLPARQRAAVLLRYVADLTESQVADAMGVTRSTVSSALAAAHRSLGRVLADDDDQHEELDRV